MLELTHKRLPVTAIIVAVVIAAGSLLTAFPSHYKPRLDREKFDSEVWKQCAARGTYLGNLSMLDDFIARFSLVGLSRQQIHNQLGCSGLSTQKTERVLLENGDCSNLKHTYLEIDFDNFWEKNPLRQKASRFRIITENYKSFGHGEDKAEATPWYN